MASTSTIVIKVKYGETLRRFNAQVSEVGRLDLDFSGLRGKVIGLFNFATDADLMLTYSDEDGDVVTLADEEDLFDVVRQSLNPLRITVKLKAGKDDRFHAKSSGNSRSTRRIPYQLQNLNSSVSGCLTSVPEPLRETLSKMAVDMASKAASPSSVLAELVDCFSKMGLSQANPVSEFPTGIESSSQGVASGSTMGASMTSKETEASRNDGLTSYMFPNVKVEEPSSKADQKVDGRSSAGGLGSLNFNAELPRNSSLSEYVSEILAPAASDNNVGDNEVRLSKIHDCHTVEKAVNTGCVDPKTVFYGVPPSDNTQDVKESGKGWYFASNGSFASIADTKVEKAVNNGDEDLTNKQLGKLRALSMPYFPGLLYEAPKTVFSSFPTGTKDVKESGKGWYAGDTMGHPVMDTTAYLGGSVDTKVPPMKLASKCPYSVPYDSPVSYTHKDSRVLPFKRSNAHNDGMGSVFHRGVQCDGCGVHPIVGPRFKSKVKEDYDLCSTCFSNMGVGTDYVRLDRPAPSRLPYSFKGLCDVLHFGVGCDGCGIHPIAGPRFKSKVKEDYDLCSACFSGMGVATDYIRLDRPAPSRHSHSLKGLRDPVCGFPQPWECFLAQPDNMGGFEMKPRQLKLDSRFIMDVNVMDGTLMAPSTPFTKIWRIRNSGSIVWPQGTKLVWIGGNKLSASLSIDLQISPGGIPLENELDISADFTSPELPGQYISYWRMASPSGQKFGQRVWVLIQVHTSLKDSDDGFQGLNLNLPPQDSGIVDPESVNGNVEPMMVEPFVDAHPNKSQELEFSKNDTLLVGGGVSNTVPPEAHASVSFPITQIASAVPSGTYVSSPSTIVPKTVQGTSENNDSEQSLLKELEEMGFKHIDLNKEILRLNDYDLEKSLDDLCGIAEWDPILEELQEMGFCDKEMNKKLLVKNNGSIKRVVMDLINGEKA